MGKFRRDLGVVVIICPNADCGAPMELSPMIEIAVKENTVLTCSFCGNQQFATRQLVDYIRQTRCYT